MKQVSKVIRPVVAGALLGITVLLSVVPAAETLPSSKFSWLVAQVPSLTQNLMHVVVYGVLCTSIAWSLEDRMTERRRWLTAFAFCSVAGILLEWAQVYVPGRFGSLLDVMLNTAGAGASVWLASFARRLVATDPGH